VASTRQESKAPRTADAAAALGAAPAGSSGPVCEELRTGVREAGLLARDRPLVAMFSGGRDSSCLLDLAVALLGAPRVLALHVNYGLRPGAALDEAHCRSMSARLGVELEVVQAGERTGAPPPTAPAEPGAGEPAGEQATGAGNLQAWARDLRYGEARRLAEERDALIATGHTASDQVETIVYRLAASPGRRALLGMPVCDGRLVRPLLSFTREQTAAYCRERAIEWREDETNEDERFARTRVREAVLPALRTVHPAAESNLLRTSSLLHEETELLDGLVAAELGGRRTIGLAHLQALPAALARMIVVHLAEEAAGEFVPQAGTRVEEIIALSRSGARAELHVGGGVAAVIYGGVLEMVKLPPRRG
jgi:tRNA(Ile)-lysidine synthase